MAGSSNFSYSTYIKPNVNQYDIAFIKKSNLTNGLISNFIRLDPNNNILLDYWAEVVGLSTENSDSINDDFLSDNIINSPYIGKKNGINKFLGSFVFRYNGNELFLFLQELDIDLSNVFHKNLYKTNTLNVNLIKPNDNLYRNDNN